MGDVPWKSVKTGWRSSLAQKEDGSLWAWGDNDEGQLGVGDREGHRIPTQVGLDLDWVDFSVGGKHALATKEDGSLWAWGVNSAGNFGTDLPWRSSNPLQVGENGWVNVACNGYHSLAVKADGSTWSWGLNRMGQLGIDGLMPVMGGNVWGE